MDNFLQVNKFYDTFQSMKVGTRDDDVLIKDRPLCMDRKVVRKMDWNLGPEQRFQRFTMGNEKLYSFDVLVQRITDSEMVRAYVCGLHAG
jgi:hypothetical protein